VGVAAEGAEPARALALARTLVRGVASDAALAALLDLIEHPDPLVRRNAAWGLGRAPLQQSPEGLARVAAALDGYDRGDEAGAHLVRALGPAGDPVAVPRTADWRAPAPDSRPRVAAAEALATSRLADEARAPLLDALDDG